MIMKETLKMQRISNTMFGLVNGHWLLMFVLCGWEDSMMQILLLSFNVNGLIVLDHTFLKNLQ